MGRGDVATHYIAQACKRPNAIAGLGHQRRVVVEFTALVGGIAEGEYREVGLRVPLGSRVVGAVHASHIAVFYPRIGRCREGGTVFVARGVAHHTVVAHQGVVAKERDVGFIAVGNRCHRGGGKHVHRWIAADGVVHIHRVGVDATGERGGCRQNDACPTAVGIYAVVGVGAHGDGGGHHTLGAGVDADVVDPPCYRVGVERSRALTLGKDKLDDQFALVGGHLRSDHIVEVETLRTPHGVAYRRIVAPSRIGVFVEGARGAESRCLACSVVLLTRHGHPLVVGLVGTLVVDGGQLVVRPILRQKGYVVEIERDVTQRRVGGEIERVEYQLHIRVGLLHQLYRPRSTGIEGGGVGLCSRRCQRVVLRLARFKSLRQHFGDLCSCRKTKNGKNRTQ